VQKDKQFRVSGRWALASDGVQWVLQLNGGSVSFIHTTKDLLARCMREKGTPPDDADRLLDGLPDTFDAWHDALGGQGHLHPAEALTAS
jgi:hypothetical protein